MFLFLGCHPEAPVFGAEGSERVICHPEATWCSPPKDLGAPREWLAFFASRQNARLARCHISEGGENCVNPGQSRAIRAVFPAFGSAFHRLLDFSS
jgi:hypothetical protein